MNNYEGEIYMKLLFKQKMFSWFDSYTVYDEHKNKVFEVKGQLSWGHLLKIYDSNGHELGKIDEKVISLTPRFDIIENGKRIGSIKRKIISLFGPSYDIDFKGWKAEGNIFEWNYTIKDKKNNKIAKISKEFFHLTDTYSLDIVNPNDALYVLMFVIAIDAEKCSREQHEDG